MLLGLTLVATAAAMTSDDAEAHRAAVQRAVFEHCPRVVSGDLDLGSADAAASIGYRLAASHPQRTNVESGSGATSIVIWGPAPGNDETRQCIVTFAAPDMKADFDALEAAARARGYDGKDAGEVTPVSRQLELRKVDAAVPNFYMVEVGGGADYLGYDRAILVLTY